MTSQPTPAPVDLDGCAREPIQIPGAIQPHGALLACREPDLVCLQASANAEGFLGAPVLGRTLRDALGDSFHARVEAACAVGDPQLASPMRLTINGVELDATLHRHDGLLFVEFELVDPAPASNPHRILLTSFAAMRASVGLEALYPIIARAVAQLSGFDRVMVYRFHPDWHGEVVGEALSSPAVDSYFGLHYPASDIPAQARSLYEKSWLRLIPTVDYVPAPLEPAANPLTGQPLDLSFATLRSVSPIHLEYLRNMGVGASMSISLLVEGRLWGLVACHHRQPHHVPAAARAACELLGQAASTEIAARLEKARAAANERAQQVQTRFFDVLSHEEDVFAALVRYTPQLREIMGAGGVAVWVDGQASLVGQTPPRPAVETLVQWLKTQDLRPLLATDCLASLVPEAAAWAEVASGVLAVRLSRVEDRFVLWFRPEVSTTVRWAGDPHKPVDVDARMHPRKSFEAWQETVRGNSRPWTDPELDGARELHQALNALVLRRSERLLQLNRELERKNTDLNSFAHIAAHDLREPLRGINNFSRFLRAMPAVGADSDAARMAETITALSDRVDGLLDALLHYSEVGRIELRCMETPLDRLVTESLETLSVVLSDSGMEVRRPRALPSVVCDPVLVREVFTNLIANACKYSPAPTRWVEIAWREGRPGEGERGPILFVRDGGIGVRARHQEDIFQIFRRLHGRDQYGGGSGVGLAIVKNVAERHGGRAWVESEFGHGATFCFTLR